MEKSYKSCYQKFNLTWILTAVVGVLMVTATSCTSVTGSDDNEGFVDEWSSANWTQSGILGGSTFINGSADSLILSYDVNLGNPGGGVSPRTAIFQVEAPTSGTVHFEWEYTGFHAFFLPLVELTLRSGSETNALVDKVAPGGGNFTFSGSTSIAVSEGEPLEFEVGGRNLDSNSRLRGDVKITEFRIE